jgi:hypothetical protein
MGEKDGMGGGNNAAVCSQGKATTNYAIDNNNGRSKAAPRGTSLHVSCTLHPDLSSVDSRSATLQSSTIFPPGEHLSLGNPSASRVGDGVSTSRDCADGGGGLQSVIQRAASFSVRESSRQKLFEFERCWGELRGARFLGFECR